MPDQQIVTGQCVWEKSSANAKIQIFQLNNGRHKGFVRYQTPTMPRALTFETQEADDIQQAKQFAYFILHEASEYQ